MIDLATAEDARWLARLYWRLLKRRVRLWRRRRRLARVRPDELEQRCPQLPPPEAGPSFTAPAEAWQRYIDHYNQGLSPVARAQLEANQARAMANAASRLAQNAAAQASALAAGSELWERWQRGEQYVSLTPRPRCTCARDWVNCPAHPNGDGPMGIRDAERFGLTWE